MNLASTTSAPDLDLLYGVEHIADHLRLTRRQVYHPHDQGQIPTFKIGGKVYARRSSLTAHFARREAAPNTGDATTSAAPTRDYLPAMVFGYRASGAHLGILPSEAEQRDRDRQIPTYLADGCIRASTIALVHYIRTNGER